MKTYYLLLVLCIPMLSLGQYKFEPSQEYPFGLPNPKAPKELLDFAPLIGECNCKSQNRNPDQTWAEPVDMKWRFKYIMNGMAVQDETLKADGRHSGSIRQFIADSTKWYVHYYSSAAPTPKLSAWKGVKNNNGDIVLYKEQKAPNGTDGFSRLTFSAINEKGFKWVGEWVDTTESVVFPFWKIDCTNGKIPSSE
ncbi:hypothetical protein MTsPCn9_28150 [Croceitalea sp. MTPC9]|uniref:hypothetical protein n=1 Tax=unclassified Croceitalea TaxID=2632280 RepID=UPI002B3CB768|nr:hypothetical protein MTsPCn6_22030 [Croceitalea sp. MTPC6]GMN17877.1 hypothetical protein MTsPCn9_28150 [Croceitalea sp. MTPC9]